MIVAVRERCSACQRAASQLQRLVQDARAQQAPWVVTVVSSDSTDDLSNWIKTNRIIADNVIGGMDLRRKGFRATPTVVLAGPGGIVSDLIVGELLGNEEQALSDRLRGVSVRTVVRNDYARTINRGHADKLVAAGATLLLVVGRSVGKPTLPEGARHLPYDEIADRAAAELDLLRPIVVDCSGLRLGRCEMAAEDLMSAGASRVFIVPGQGGG
jgi:hypothetical protein